MNDFIRRSLLTAGFTILVAIVCCLTSCSSPGSAANDPFRVAQGHAMLNQAEAQRQIGLRMAGASPSEIQAMRPLAPLAPLATPRR